MKTKAILAALALVIAPVSGVAAGCAGHQEASMSCAEGSVWNPETKACERTTS